jgi:hypothetical protein
VKTEDEIRVDHQSFGMIGVNHTTSGTGPHLLETDHFVEPDKMVKGEGAR